MPEPPIIAPWIIEKIREREEQQRKRRDQPQPQLPIPEDPRPPRRAPEEGDPDDGNRRGVEYIEPGSDGAPDINETISFL